jgi:hypothetical protein
VPKEKYDKSSVILEVTSGRTTGGQRNNFIVTDLKNTQFYLDLNHCNFKSPLNVFIIRNSYSSCPKRLSSKFVLFSFR